MRLLVIDDDADMRRLVAAKARAHGIEVFVAGTGREGCGLALSCEPSVIVLDLRMPDLSGEVVLETLKRDPATSDVPVVVVSAVDVSTAKAAALDLGAADYVVKPFDFSELVARLRNAHRTHELLRLLRERGHLDALTGLWNRQRFDEVLLSQTQAASRTGTPMALAMIDLDHFKAVNDRFGHQAGDEVLARFGELLQFETRAYDTACRYGGEEFAIVLGSTTEVEAERLCERVLERTRALRVPGLEEIRTTVSIGLTGVPLSGDASPSGWVGAADRALYFAKRSGRDRIAVFDEGSGDTRTVMRLAG